jgi:hypothetical protein
MVETTIEIRSADDVAETNVGSNATGETEQQAELVSFAHLAATVMAELGDEGSALASSLLQADDAPAQTGGLRAAELEVVARFLDTRSGPRMFFRLRRHGSRAQDGSAVSGSVCAVFGALLRERETELRYTAALVETARLLGHVGTTGGVVRGSEFDLALAAADVAWRKGAADDPTAAPAWGEPTCPGCGNAVSFELRLWPSERSALRRCLLCGSGVWLRARRRPRLLPADVWRAMEDVRGELVRAGKPVAPVGAVGDANGSRLLLELKRVFAENRWPFSEIRGAPVLLSELSGSLGSWKFYAQAVEEQQLVLLYSVCPLRVPEERRLEASSFLTRANYGLTAGNFELDFADGEIRYKTVLQLSGDRLDAATLKRIVRANGIAMETYLPGIGAVITGTEAALALERRASS